MKVCLVIFRWFVCFVVIYSTLPRLHAQAQQLRPLRTLDILDTLVRTASRSIVKQLGKTLFSYDTLLVQVKSHEGAWLLEQYLFASNVPLKRFRAATSITVSTAGSTTFFTDSSRPTTTQTVSIPQRAQKVLTLHYLDLAVRYFPTDDFVNVTREVDCAISGHIETSTGLVQVLETCSEHYRDTVPRTLVATLDSKQYSFTNAPVPDAVPNFWKQVVEPTVIVLAGALVVAILFFVRSQ
jgi:hypothetical protein